MCSLGFVPDDLQRGSGQQASFCPGRRPSDSPPGALFGVPRPRFCLSAPYRRRAHGRSPHTGPQGSSAVRSHIRARNLCWGRGGICPFSVQERHRPLPPLHAFPPSLLLSTFPSCQHSELCQGALQRSILPLFERNR